MHKLVVKYGVSMKKIIIYCVLLLKENKVTSIIMFFYIKVRIQYFVMLLKYDYNFLMGIINKNFIHIRRV